MEDNRTIILREGEMSIAPETTGLALIHRMQESPRARTYTVIINERQDGDRVIASSKTTDDGDI